MPAILGKSKAALELRLFKNFSTMCSDQVSFCAEVSTSHVNLVALFRVKTRAQQDKARGVGDICGILA